MTLKFKAGNAKLAKDIITFTLPSGHTCPGALHCKAAVSMDGGRARVIDGPHQKYRCFMASREALYKGLREMAERNRDALFKARTYTGMRDLIVDQLTEFMKNKRTEFRAVRVHVGGDFFNQNYFDAWMSAAKHFPKLNFYAYTKSLNYWVRHLDSDFIPENFQLTASDGGRYDHLIMQHGLKTVRVVMHPEEAEVLELEIDHDDSHAMDPEVGNFALLLHGTQQAGTPAAAAKIRMDREEIKYSYSADDPKKPTGYNFKEDVKEVLAGR